VNFDAENYIQKTQAKTIRTPEQIGASPSMFECLFERVAGAHGLQARRAVFSGDTRRFVLDGGVKTGRAGAMNAFIICLFFEPFLPTRRCARRMMAKMAVCPSRNLELDRRFRTL
jgi:hypothetical protein